MPQTSHIERHFTGTATVRDIVIGMSDGLTVPFAPSPGLSGAVDTTGIMVTAGLAEIAAGSMAMGLGGSLAAKSAAEHYEAERKREATKEALPGAARVMGSSCNRCWWQSRAQIAALAVQHRLPTVALLGDFTEAGCLIGYGPNLQILARRAALYVDKPSMARRRGVS
jgi:VIT family